MNRLRGPSFWANIQVLSAPSSVFPVRSVTRIKEPALVYRKDQLKFHISREA